MGTLAPNPGGSQPAGNHKSNPAALNAHPGVAEAAPGAPRVGTGAAGADAPPLEPARCAGTARRLGGPPATPRGFHTRNPRQTRGGERLRRALARLRLQPHPRGRCRRTARGRAVPPGYPRGAGRRPGRGARSPSLPLPLPEPSTRRRCSPAGRAAGRARPRGAERSGAGVTGGRGNAAGRLG